MSSYTTLNITRTKARTILIESVLNKEDYYLEQLMDKLLEDRLYNCIIVSDEDTINDDYVI